MRWKKLLAALTAVLIVGLALILVLQNAVKRHRAAGQMEASMAADHPKQLWHCGMHRQVIQDHPGDCPICHMALTPIGGDSAPSDKAAERKVLYWWDPMLGPSSIADHPGKSAMGMDMVPVYAEQAGPEVRIDPTVVQNMGVRTAVVMRGPLHKTVRTVGLLKLPEPGLHDVSLKVGGWIDKLYADQDGMHVVQGEPLFDLYSPDLQVAEQELIAAVKSEKSMPPNVGLDVRREAHGMVESSRRKLLLWGVAEQDVDAIAKADEPPRDVPFRSPATGHVEDKAIVQGSAVQPMTKLLRVADHTTMWLDAQVYSDQIPVVKEGQEVIARVDGVPGKTWKGTISFIYPHLDHMTRTLTARVTINNPDFELKPGMYATADINTQPVPDVIQVPREAVIDTGTRQIAFVTDGSGHFTPRAVRTGLAGDDDQVQVVEGLAPGETVVTSGQFLMDVESRTIEATQKLTVAPSTHAIAEQSEMPGPATAPALTAIGTHDLAVALPTHLSVAYCPMAKARWLQPGDAISNPYLGPEMTSCGSVQKKVQTPAAGSALSPVVRAYLDLAAGLNAGRLDPVAANSLKAGAERLSGDDFGPLRQAADALAGATTLADARAAFHALSDQLVVRLSGPAN